MELYDQLASNEESQRMKASAELVRKIVDAQKNGNEEKGTDLAYALPRLVKGLSSGRESARLGFSITLTELLYESTEIEASEVLELIEKHTTPSGKLSGIEERDFYFGKLFGLGTLIHSGILVRPKTSLENISTIIHQLFNLALIKPWLREPSAKTLCGLIDLIPQINGATETAGEIYRTLEKEGLVRSQDGAAILLALGALPTNIRPKPSEKVWQHGDPLHHSNVFLLSKVLKDVPGEEDAIKPSGNFKSHPHFIWTFILQKNWTAPKEAQAFKSLWDKTLENGFFATSSSLERKFLGFQLFQMCLYSLNASLIPTLFSENCMRCMINHSLSGDRYLNKAAKKSLSTIVSVCKEKPDVSFQLYQAIVGYSTNFDRLTKSKTIEEIYSLIPREDLSGLSKFLQGNVVSHKESERKWFADQILTAFRHRLEDFMEADIGECFQFLVRYGFFESKSFAKPDQLMIREKLFSLLALMTSDSLQLWSRYSVMEIVANEKTNDRVVKLDSQIKKIRKSAVKRMNNLSSANVDGQSQQIRGMETLFALALLQLYNGDTEAVSVLQDLELCYDSIIKQGEMQTEILVEVILGFLSKPSTLQRKLSEQVFASFSSSLTPAGLKLLLDVLLTPETVSGAEDLFDHEMENAQEGEDGGEDEEGEGEDNDEEEVSESEGGEEDDDDEAEDGMELDEDEDVVSNDGSNDDELTAALSAALGTTKELANGDDDSSDESLMDDDEMMAIDENLANIFRQRLKPNRAKEAKDTKQQMSTFKCKVIDLLDILVRNHSLLCLEMILPLLQVLRITKSETVHSKTITLLRKLAKAKELPESTGDLMGLLRKIHEDAAKARNKDGNVHSQLSIYIARIARKRGQEEEVIGVYAETMRKWIKNGKSMVRAGLFADWVNWCQSIRR